MDKASKEYANNFANRVNALGRKLTKAEVDGFIAEAKADYQSGKITCQMYNNVYGFVMQTHYNAPHPLMVHNARGF